MKLIYCLTAALVVSMTAYAQDTPEKEKRKALNTESGLKVDKEEGDDVKEGVYATTKNDTTKKRTENKFDFTFAVVDVGINSLQDKTDYSSAEASNFLNVPANMKNEQLFSLRSGKSWNVNVWPFMFKARLAKSKYQKVYVSSGVGLQMYNFRFNKDISYLNNTTPEVYLDSVDFSKNKLGFTYLSVPLSLTLKTKVAKGTWLVYGAGVTGGYRLSSWTKQESGLRGKQKNHDAFNFNDFNACVTGELGISGIFRIYATYQLTPLHSTALAQYPLSIGLRFGGV